MGGANQHDLVIGDSYSPRGRAMGGAKDVLNSGPDGDVIVGDSYTRSGIAIGSGSDRLHGLTGADSMFGDNRAASRGRVRGGGRDLLTRGGGNDHLHGGPQDDHCAGGPDRDTQNGCELVTGDSVAGGPGFPTSEVVPVPRVEPGGRGP